MGILLIGIVAALFFRNEPLTMDEVPTVRREQELNDHLKQRDVSVYLNDTRRESPGSSELSEHPWTLRHLLDDLESRNDGVPVPVGIAGAGGRAPHSPAADSEDRFHRLSEPLPPLPRPDSVRETATSPSGEEESLGVTSTSAGVASAAGNSAGPVLPESRVGELAELFPDHAGTAADPKTSAIAFDDYVVEYGDTLSGIARKKLGAHNRYSEIYEANRDRMTSPDQLRVGMTLRIPRY